MLLLVPVFLSGVLALADPPPPGTPRDSAHRLFSDFWTWRLRQSPEFATLAGESQHNSLLEQYTEERFLGDFVASQEFHERAKSLLDESSDLTDRNNLEFFLAEVETFIEGFPHGGFYFPMSFRAGLHLNFQKLAGWASVSSLADFQDLLARYHQFPTYVDQVVGVMVAGIGRNMTNHLASMEGVVDQVRSHLIGDVEDSAFYRPFVQLDSNANITEQERQQLRLEAVRSIQEEMRPALARLAVFLEEEYIPACRKDVGASSLPGGKFYQACIRFHTSTDLTAIEVHQMGVEEVARIESEMEEVIQELGLNLTLKQFFSTIREDPKNFFSSGEEVLEAYRAMVHDKVLPSLPELFHTVPDMRLEIVEQLNPEASSASYITGTADGSRPGKFFVNTAKYQSQSRHTVATLVLHEALPGHHLQGAVLVTGDFPAFRKVLEDRVYSQAPSRFPLNTAYTEGWALYSETLGYGMGLYDNPMNRFGHLNNMIFRACRLVVDTGLHAFGWTMEEAAEYLLAHSARSEESVGREVRRYITIPGQALGYKVGQLKLQQLREKAETELGAKFSIKDFHEVVLNAAGPLYMTERNVKRYIQETLRGEQ